MQVYRHLCELGTGRQGSGGAAILEHGLEETLEHRHRAEGGRTEVELVGVEEVHLDRGRPRVDQPAAQLRAEVIGHAGSRRGGEGDRLGQRRCRHIAAAEELGVTGPAARRWESHAWWQIRRREGQADRPHIAWGAVLDHRGGAGHGPARNTHRTVARQGRVTDLGAGIGKEIRTDGGALRGNGGGCGISRYRPPGIAARDVQHCPGHRCLGMVVRSAGTQRWCLRAALHRRGGGLTRGLLRRASRGGVRRRRASCWAGVRWLGGGEWRGGQGHPDPQGYRQSSDAADVASIPHDVPPLIAINATGVAPYQTSAAAGSMGCRTEPAGGGGSGSSFGGMTPEPVRVATTRATAWVTPTRTSPLS